MDARQERGLTIAKDKRIRKITDAIWMVPSQSHTGTYAVDLEANTCSCPDHETRACKCKHIWAVEYVRQQVTNPDGTTTVSETLTVKRATYRQDWSAYNTAQCEEKAEVQKLLRGLCDGIMQPAQPSQNRGGRPRLPLADVVYGATMKVYTTFSGRRATTDIRECEAKGFVDHAPHYNSIFRYLEQPTLTPLLKTLVEESALPLKAIESSFAVDGTGFATSVYSRWFDHKYGREMKQQQWVKAHAMIGVKTNIVTSIEVTEGNANDCPEFAGLVTRTANRFNVAEVSADKAYLSGDNLATVEAVGAVPYIPFKSNSQGEGPEAWRRMWHFFNYRRDEFLAHYHQRSNVESAFSMMKRKFGASVRSKLPTAQFNEVLCKVLCHNLAVLVHERRELGVEPLFYSRKMSEVA